jgi:DNA-binding CsgD family transcriptional regulator/pimeloyl-ACP methyl ester carboxylesterase
MDAPPVQYVTTSDGYSIAYTITGLGDPLVFLPRPFSHLGLLRDPEAARQMIEPLAARFKLVQYDGRGQGLSSRGLADGLMIEDLLPDLVAVVEQIGEPVVLVSTIGFWRVAVRYAAMHPSKCRGLVIHRPDHPVGRSKLPKHPFEDLATFSWDSFIQTMISAYPVVAGTRYTVGALRQAISQADYLRLLRAIHACDSTDILRSISTPALVIGERVPGMEDTESLVDSARQVASLIQGARFAVVDGYGEAFHTTGLDPSPGIRLILEFVAGLSAAGDPAAPASSSLSSRELEVLRLLAAGKSNAQIADELVISQNTVIRHVANIFDKTGAANRAQAAVYAKEHGIA